MNSQTRLFACIVSLFVFSQTAMAQWEMSEDIKEIQSNSMMLSQLIQLTYNKGLMSELEILDDQAKKVKEIGQEYQKQMMETNQQNMKYYKEMAELQKRVAKGDKEAKQELQDFTKDFYGKMRESQNKTIRELKEVLLPHQMKRLQQISKQQSYKWIRNSDYFGIPYAMAGELKLSKEQRRELKKVTDKIREQYYRDVAEMRQKSMKKILAKLSPEQRKRFESLVGDFYDAEKSRKGGGFQMASPKKKEKDD